MHASKYVTACFTYRPANFNDEILSGGERGVRWRREYHRALRERIGNEEEEYVEALHGGAGVKRADGRKGCGCRARVRMRGWGLYTSSGQPRDLKANRGRHSPMFGE